jgi:hypothetical protein
MTTNLAVYKAIERVMADLGKIGISKDKRNQQQGFNYRGVDDAMNALNPLLAKHGLLILPRVLKRETMERQSKSGGALFCVVLEVEYDFIATSDGSTKVVGPVVGEGMDSGDKASNKAMSIAYKYACFQAFCIPTEVTAIEADAEGHSVLTPAQALGKSLVEALVVGVDEKVFEIWEQARTDKKTFEAAWYLLTVEEKDGINKALKRARAAREAA